MPVSRPEPFPPGLLRPTADLRRLGETPEDRDPAGGPKWAKVRRGVVVRAHVWSTLTAGQRHSALVHATALQMTSGEPPPFSHSAAAALWRLPRVTAWPTQVDVTVSGGGAHSSGTVRRHGAQVPVSEVERVAGLPVTPLVRTLLDLARTEELTDSVAAVDHALHHRLCTREELEAELELVPGGARGRARAALVVAFAEAGAMSVGESLSRVQMFRLNIPRPRLQVRIEDADGLAGIGDFGWERERVVGEFDGRMKYAVPAGATSEQAAEVLWREKRREDRIRATQRRMARWVWADAARPIQMAAKLAAQGVERQPRNTWFEAA